MEGRAASRTTSRSARSSPTGIAWARTSRRAMQRVPISMNVGVKKFFCGPESFTPDLQPIVGEAPELKNYFVARRAQLDRHPHRRRPRPRAGALDRQRPARRRRHRLPHRSPARATRPTPSTAARAPSSRSAWSTSATTRRARCRPRAARSSRRSTIGSPRAARTSATSAAGRAPTGTRRRATAPRVEQLSWGRQHWFPYWEAEHRAAREGVILMDMSFMSKFLVEGRDAGRAAQLDPREQRRRRRPARSRTRSGSTRPASCRRT